MKACIRILLLLFFTMKITSLSEVFSIQAILGIQ